MKLLHSSDLLIGQSFPHAYPRAEELRAARFGVLDALLARVRPERAEAVILAGNTLADNRVPERDLKSLARALMTSPVPVYLLPGITDPYTPDSPFRRHQELFAPPVQILHNPEPVVLAGATLYPMPVRSRREAPPFAVPARGPDAGLRIGIACSREAPELLELDYLLLGGRAQHEAAERLAWPGAPESVEYGHGRGRALLVTLAEGTVPQLKSMFVGRFHWFDRDLSLKSAGKLREELEGIKDPSTVVQRLALKGQLDLVELVEVLNLLREWRSKLFHLQVDDQLTLSPGQEKFFNDERLLETLAARVAQESDPRQALLELYELASEQVVQ